MEGQQEKISVREWTGNAVDLRDEMEARGIVEVVFEFDGGETDTFTSKLRDEFRAYEIYQMGGYIDAVIGTIRKGQRS